MAQDPTLYSVLQLLATVSPVLRGMADLSQIVGDSVEIGQHGLALRKDDRLAALARRYFPHPSGVVRPGKVLYAVPYANLYYVRVDGVGVLRCCAVMPGGLTPLSASPAAILPAFSSVLVFWYEGSPFGYILGAIPELVRALDRVFPDWIEQGGNTGMQREPYYRKLESFNRKAGLLDFSSCRPFDATALGEWGVMNDLGMGIFLDGFMAFMRADETAGIWFHWMDHFVRLAAYNFNLETAGSETNARDDEGEYQHIVGFTPYPWEALGLLDPDEEAARQNDAESVLRKKAEGAWEPVHADQAPFYRLHEYYGYLGQGYMRDLALPPQENPGIYRYGTNLVTPGVFREQIGLDGSYALQSAHSLHFLKRIFIPIPRRKRLWEDQSDGDGGKAAKPYKPAGKWKEGPEHKIAATIEPAEDTSLPNLRTVAGLQELHAHLCQWKGMHPFHYHEGDYDTPKSVEELPSASAIQKPPEFVDLGKKQWLPQPDPIRWRVDHRYGEVEYYETAAGISILPDGSVVIRDGYGSEIVMTGGSILLRAAGDIWRTSGRSCIDWAGDDAIVKARRSIDLTSSEADVRLKAEQNLEMLAGNGGKGRMLFENRAKGRAHDYGDAVGEEIEGSDIVFRAPDSQVVAMAKGVYLRTGSADGGVQSGDIVLDADRGRKSVIAVASTFDRYLQRSARDTFMSGKSVKARHVADAEAVYVDGSLKVKDSIVNSNGGIQTSGDILVSNGHIFTQYAGSYSGFVGSGTASRGLLRDIEQRAEDGKKEGQKLYQSDVDSAYHASRRLGNAEVQKVLQFSLRNEEQYGTTEFALPEACWQHLAQRSGAEGLKSWEEPVVRFQQEELMPYPGTKAWKEGKFLRYTDTLHDPATGKDASAEDRDGYENPRFSAWEEAPFQSNYYVIRV